MNYKINLEASDREFVCSENEPILDAALRDGVQLAYGCRSGTCGACKATLIEGKIEYGEITPEALSAEDIKTDKILCCQARPKSDLLLQAKTLSSEASVSIKNLPTRVVKMEPLSHDVMGLWLQLPSTERLAFLAGQYIDIQMKDGKQRSFSLANAPHDDEFLQLHIRHYDGGIFSELVFHEMKEKSLLRIKGPFGGFCLNEQSELPAIFVAGGTGFAPVKGIIEHLIAKQDPRQIHLYWGVRAKRDLYMNDLIQGWVEAHTNIRYVPVLSEPMEEDDWSEKTGFVHDAVLEDFAELSAHEVYASGPPIMVEAAQKSFTKRGLTMDRMFSDAFEFAKDK